MHGTQDGSFQTVGSDEAGRTMRRLTLHVRLTVRVESAGKFSVVVGAGMPTYFRSLADARTYVGSLGADVRELDAWSKEAKEDGEQAKPAGER